MEERCDKMEARLTVLEERQNKCERWEAEHDGRINAWWENQFRHNKDIDRRMTAVERKVVWASGFSAGAGAVLGIAISKIIGG